MVFSIDMRRIKRESYRIIRQDGLSDICAGLMLGIMAIFFFEFRYSVALIVGCAMQTIVLPVCRKKFTYPCVGYVKFPGRADKKSLIVWDIAVPLVVVGLIICVGIWVRPLLPLCLGAFLAGLSLAGARITGYVRDYIFVGLFFDKRPCWFNTRLAWLQSVCCYRLSTLGLVRYPYSHGSDSANPFFTQIS